MDSIKKLQELKQKIKDEGNDRSGVYRGYKWLIMRPGSLLPTKERDFLIHLCGYVAIPKSHPLYGKNDDDEEIRNLDVHGGITYADYRLNGKKFRKYWIIGFDCAHTGDIFSVYQPTWKMHAEFEAENPQNIFAKETYKDMDYVKQQCKNIINQLIAMKK